MNSPETMNENRALPQSSEIECSVVNRRRLFNLAQIVRTRRQIIPGCFCRLTKARLTL